MGNRQHGRKFPFEVDFQAIRGTRRPLADKPREDLLSIREAAAEYEVAELPPPPPEAPRAPFPWLVALVELIGIVPLMFYRWRFGRSQRLWWARDSNPGLA